MDVIHALALSYDDAINYDVMIRHEIGTSPIAILCYSPFPVQSFVSSDPGPRLPSPGAPPPPAGGRWVGLRNHALDPPPPLHSKRNQNVIMG